MHWCALLPHLPALVHDLGGGSVVCCRLVTRVRSSLHQRALHQRALRQRADGLEALWCGKDEDSHPASRTATPTLHSQRRQALTIVAQHEHLLEGVAVLEALPAHCTLHDAAPVS